MKTIITGFILILWSLSSAVAQSCCAGAASANCGNSLGTLSNYNKHFVGIRMQQRGFRQSQTFAFDENTVSSTDLYLVSELWGRAVLSSKFNVLATIPFVWHTHTKSTSIEKQFGVADATLLVQYRVLEWKDTTKKNICQHLFYVSTGLKLPTGKYDPNNNGTVLSYAQMQLGTNSFDFPLGLNYTLNHKQYGLSAELNYRIQTKSDASFKFGNRLNASAKFIWQQRLNKNWILAPNIGVQYEYLEANQDNGAEVYYSGGYCFSSQVGIDVHLKRTLVALSIQPVIFQNFAHDTSRAGIRLAIHSMYFF